MRFFNVYLRGDRIIVPTQARTTSGLWLETDPVFAAKSTDPEDVRVTIGEVMAAPHPSVEDPPRRAVAAPVVLGALGVKSWRAFVLQTKAWAVSVEGSSSRVVPMRASSDGGYFEHLPSETVQIGGNAECVASGIADLILGL